MIVSSLASMSSEAFGAVAHNNKYKLGVTRRMFQEVFLENKEPHTHKHIETLHVSVCTPYFECLYHIGLGLVVEMCNTACCIGPLIPAESVFYSSGKSSNVLLLLLLL